MTTLLTKRNCRTIGIWCAYDTTLEASEGIGVFAHNLARGLAALPDGPEVVLCVRPGDERLVQETINQGDGRIRAVSTGRAPWWRRSLQRKMGRLGRRVQHWEEAFASRLEECERPGSKGNNGLLRSILVRLVDCTFRTAHATLRAVAHQVNLRHKALAACPDKRTQQVIDGCDAWLIPYFGLDLQFSRPTVVVIHDLVFFHHPEAVSPGLLPSLKDLSRRAADRSTLAACMSRFIRENDLLGVLRLPAEKIRVLQPAAPRDFARLSEADQVQERYSVLQQDFIFYPAAFRSYKNHSLLVQALALRQRAGDNKLQLVFTGIQKPPASLLQEIAAHRLENHVHILGKLERQALAAFYRKARATVVPSRYEQGSFPIMEAIHWKCPVACSRIPSLVELFEPLGSAMQFFDPSDPRELADVLRNLCDRREEILTAQQAASEFLFERTWQIAAQDWMTVFEEAADLHRQTASLRVTQKAGQRRMAA
jgi:glycosyltransferase involved in cell wall biosynthesis